MVIAGNFLIIPDKPDLPLQSPCGFPGALCQLAPPHQPHHVPLHRRQHLHDHQGRVLFQGKLTLLQVMRTVLGYFLAYSPLIVAFAIAFRILMPGSRSFG